MAIFYKKADKHKKLGNEKILQYNIKNAAARERFKRRYFY